MKEFVEQMIEAMNVMQMACKGNDTWDDCQYCPFGTYCDVLEENGLGTPDEDRFLNQQLSGKASDF